VREPDGTHRPVPELLEQAVAPGDHLSCHGAIIVVAG
jgi:hypothetical protein